MFKINILFLLNTRVFSHIKHLINCQASVKYPLTTHVAKKKKKKKREEPAVKNGIGREATTYPHFGSVGRVSSGMVWVRAQLRDRDWIQESWDNNRLLSKRKKKTTAFGWPLTQCAGKNYNSFICMLKWKDIRALRRKSFITSQKWCWRNVDRHPASRVVDSSIRRAAIGWPYDVIAKSAYQLSGPGLHIPQYALY